ncbi:MAG: hypothetical protein V4692_11195, partial [Bdellovibrionota bacterium]
MSKSKGAEMEKDTKRDSAQSQSSRTNDMSATRHQETKTSKTTTGSGETSVAKAPELENPGQNVDVERPMK